jgi:hypothetical protein
VGLLAENLGQPGFRELILRSADLETGRILPFALLAEPRRRPFAAALARGGVSRSEPVDLASPGNEVLLFAAASCGLLLPAAGPVRRVTFPKGGAQGGEIHRLTAATLLAGCGISEAVAAGAEQVVVVTGTPEEPEVGARRGARARLDGVVAALERQAAEDEVRSAERVNRIVETLGHRTGDGGHAWEDPATGRVFRDLPIYLIRPARRVLSPLQLDGARDAATEVVVGADDLLSLGYRDAYRLFVEPVVGGTPQPPREEAEAEERQAIEL